MAVREPINAQLEKLEPHVAVTIALRAAMRVLPLLALRKNLENQSFAYWPEHNRSSYVLNVFRCYQLSSFINSEPACEIGESDTVTTFAWRTAEIAEVAAGRARSSAASTSAICLAAGDALRFADAATLAADTCVSVSERIMSAAALALAEANLKGDDAVAAMHVDLQTAQNKSDFNARTAGPLWPNGIPEYMYDFWRLLQTDLSRLHEGFHIWADWYRERLRGDRADLELERKWALLPDDLWKSEPAQINAYLERTSHEHATPLRPEDPDDVLRELPKDQEPGLQFAAALDGRIDLKPSGLAPPDNLAEIAAMRGVLIKATDNLFWNDRRF